jgi:geranylgeranyl transferase type-2 subunit beta
MSGAYWTIGAIKLMGKLDNERKDEIVRFIKDCQHFPCGGFGGNLGHDPHITNTHYALLVLAMYDAVHEVDTEKIVSYIKSL